MNNKNQIYPKTFIVEFAAIVFLVITIPIWLPIALSILAGGFSIFVIILILGIITSSVAKSELYFAELSIILSQNFSLTHYM